jgi:hypothetical protein
MGVVYAGAGKLEKQNGCPRRKQPFLKKLL